MEESRLNSRAMSPERRGSDWVCTALLDKTKEFFQTCDVEGKGLITRSDMRRLHRELPLSAEELEDVFDSLDTEYNGYLTLDAFSSGFSQFLRGRRISVSEDLSPAPPCSLQVKETLYQSHWEARLAAGEDEEEKHFCTLLESLGAGNMFEDPGEVRILWTQLRRDEPHLLSNFEEFLARVTDQIKEAHQEKTEMESALQRKAATHDSEICRLYEEMEAQIKHEKDSVQLQDSEHFHVRSRDLEHQLFMKESELDQIFQKQRQLELQCCELSSQKQECRVENVKLKMTNGELCRELDSTCQELAVAQEQLRMLQEQAARLHHEKELEMYRVTEGLQREKQSLMKQLDLLSDEDESPAYNASAPVWRWQQPVTKRSSVLANSHARLTITTPTAAGVARGNVEGEGDGLDTPPDGWPLRRVISIEEDHLLHGDPQPFMHQLSDKEEDNDDDDAGDEEAPSDVETRVAPAAEPPASPAPTYVPRVVGGRSRFGRTKTPPAFPRGQPVGKETQHKATEGALLAPDRLFKVVLVGNSSVGKTSLLRTFCEGCFHPCTLATVGIDYSVKTLTLGNTRVAMQLWDTAGQERYRSITKQFFRKADGVVVMYDVTLYESFRAVRPWLANVQKNKVMFYEVSAYTGYNVTESLTHLARVLMEQEDRVRDTTVLLTAQPIKKSACCK